MPARHLARHKAPRSIKRSLGRFAAGTAAGVPLGGAIGAVGFVGAVGVATGVGVLTAHHDKAAITAVNHVAYSAAAQHPLAASARQALAAHSAAGASPEVSRSENRPPVRATQRAVKTSKLTAGGQGVSGAVTRTVAPTDPRAIAMSLLPSYGWSSDQFGCLDAIWQRESGWNPSAQNPYSGAYGIPQALPGSKMGVYGGDWAADPTTQIKWGLAYIRNSYGSPCGAWDFWETHDWY
ncbi:MAG: transglycosylase SLT domain-containing protein [Nocardioidaceae bacterium]